MTTIILWALVAMAVVVAMGLGIGKLQASSKARGAAKKAPKEPVHVVPQPCRANGHAYGEFETGWRCATCGNHVARRDGELYGLVSEGKRERRREAR
jgi:hypothetical protein